MHLEEVIAFPSVRVPPQSQTVTVGGSATFSAKPQGTGPFKFQWFWNGQLIQGATEQTVTFYDLDLDQVGGKLTVQISSPEGKVTSFPATLKVNPVQSMINNLKLVPAVTFTGTVGGKYLVEYRNEFTPTNTWLSLTNITLQSSPSIFLDFEGGGKEQRFYRLITP